MKIDGRVYRTNVLILCMLPEIDVTVQTIETLLESAHKSVTISLLLNGGASPRLRNLLNGHPTIKYYESDKNLGVAGGRNFLLRQDECREADIVFILDNDVITPTDYIQTLASFLIEHPEAGVVGGVAANINQALNFRMFDHYGDAGAFGGKLFKVTSSEIKKSLVDDLKPQCLYHMGTHPNYYYAYLSIRPILGTAVKRVAKIFGIKLFPETSLAGNERYFELIRAGIPKYEVTNVAGCSQAFRRELVDQLGYLDERFNPYGWEDVDFCIRALKAGRKNYIDTNTWLYHGTDSRHKERDPVAMAIALFRGRTILTSNILGTGKRYRLTMLKLAIVTLLFELPRWRITAFAKFFARYQGYRLGRQAVLNAKKNGVRELTRLNGISE